MATRKIIFDTSDKKNTLPEKRISVRLTDGLTTSTKTIFSGLFFSMIKSPIFWILCIGISVFQYFFLFMMLIMPSLGVTDISSSLWWLAYGVPLIMLAIIIFPSFLISSRDSSLFKRMSTIGVSKIQIYCNYMLGSLLIFSLVLFILVFPVPFIMNIITLAVMTKPLYDMDLNTVNVIFGNANAWFYVLVLFGTFGTLSMGYKRGMKMKSTSKSMMLGLGLWVFMSFIGGSDALFAITVPDLWDSIDLSNGDSSAFAQVTLFSVLLVFKFAYIVNPISLFLFATSITITDSAGEGHKFFESNALTYYVSIISSLVLSIYYIIWVAINAEKITNYETTR